MIKIFIVQEMNFDNPENRILHLNEKQISRKNIHELENKQEAKKLKPIKVIIKDLK